METLKNDINIARVYKMKMLPYNKHALMRSNGLYVFFTHLVILVFYANIIATLALGS
jgi:hypothetical protein